MQWGLDLVAADNARSKCRIEEMPCAAQQCYMWLKAGGTELILPVTGCSQQLRRIYTGVRDMHMVAVGVLRD